MSDKTPETPLYLTQGSVILIFSNTFQAIAAYKECLAAFEGDGIVGEIKIKTKETLDYGIPGQPNKPWLNHKHNCVICGLAELPHGFRSNPERDDIIISPMPPIPVGNNVDLFGIHTIRLQAAHIVPELAIIAKAG